MRMLMGMVLAWPVGGHDHLNLTQILETVQLVQQLHQSPLDLPVNDRMAVY